MTTPGMNAAKVATVAVMRKPLVILSARMRDVLQAHVQAE